MSLIWLSTFERQNIFAPVGYYSRVTGADGDTITLDFTKGSPNSSKGALTPTFYSFVGWCVTPATGATVTIEYAFRPDFDKDTAAHWINHADHASVTAATKDLEGSPLAAMRFTAASAGMTVEVWASTKVEAS